MSTVPATGKEPRVGGTEETSYTQSDFTGEGRAQDRGTGVTGTGPDQEDDRRTGRRGAHTRKGTRTVAAARRGSGEAG